MRKADMLAILIKAAEVSSCTEFVVIGSQAIHGTWPDPEMDVVLRSNDLDLFPLHGYGDSNVVYEELMLHLGQDSDFDLETGTYIEAVSETLARLPPDWSTRTLREVVGSVEIGGSRREVTVIFPEIHDLTVSKLAIRREKDLEFLAGVVDLGLVEQSILRSRYQQTPRITNDLSRDLRISTRLLIDAIAGILKRKAEITYQISTEAARGCMFPRCRCASGHLF
jgi:hypothetical protein